MKAEIITIGDEILIGQIVDTNSQFIGQQLNKIGVSVYQITSIQDDKKHILNALKEAQNRVDIVILTGGLGPTKDDITKKTIAEYFNDDELIEYPEVVTHIKGLFKKINHPFKEIQRTQAQLPSWSPNRANILVWMVEEQGYDRNIAWEHSESSNVAALRSAAKLRGLPITIPGGDFDDVTGVNVSDLWGGFIEPIGQAIACSSSRCRERGCWRRCRLRPTPAPLQRHRVVPSDRHQTQ